MVLPTCRSTVTHPSTNRARRRVTLLMGPTTLPTKPNPPSILLSSVAIITEVFREVSMDLFNGPVSGVHPEDWKSAQFLAQLAIYNTKLHAPKLNHQNQLQRDIGGVKAIAPS